MYNILDKMDRLDSILYWAGLALASVLLASFSAAIGSLFAAFFIYMIFGAVAYPNTALVATVGVVTGLGSTYFSFLQAKPKLKLEPPIDTAMDINWPDALEHRAPRIPHVPRRPAGSSDADNDHRLGC